VNSLSYILATAGHVDHGKSALVRALTGTDPDRLPEEKARGITIELGFAHLLLQTPAAALEVGLVDVPGHEDFVKNMVAGVGSIDAALLVVAADDGWMPQTEEHLQILSYLGLRHGVVALTKADLAADLPGAVAAVRQRLVGSPLELAAIVPTSVVEGRGIEALRAALSEMLLRTPPQRDIGKPRLPVDRAFTLKGVGTVVTGTLTGGTLCRGQEVSLRPSGARARIRSVQTYAREIERGVPGSRVALNLPDLTPAGHGSTDGRAVRRGDVVTLEELGAAATVIDVLLERSPRAALRPAVRGGSLVRLHHGSSAVAARLRLFDAEELAPRGRCLARLALQTPIFVFAGDRFVVRDWPELHTLGGGLVLDVDPPRLRKLEAQRALLAARAASPGDVRVYVHSLLNRDRVLERSKVLTRSRFGALEIVAAIDAAVHAGAALAAGELVFDAAAFAEMLRGAAAAVDAHHRAHPEQSGLPLAELRRAAVWRGAPSGAADAVLAAMCADGFVRRGSAIASSAHRLRLPPRLEPAGLKLRAILTAQPFQPPPRRQLAADDLAAQALKFLIAAGEAVEIGPDVVMSSDAYAQAVQRVRIYLRQQGAATVAQLKTMLGSNRRVMVPLVEKLDRDGITRRDGDVRTLRQTAAAPV
jgi:selenocysteine-specific elongation factor